MHFLITGKHQEMMNRIYKLLTKAIGMKTTCCHTDQYAIVEDNAICTNETCSRYFCQTNLKNIFTISFSRTPVKPA